MSDIPRPDAGAPASPANDPSGPASAPPARVRGRRLRRVVLGGLLAVALLAAGAVALAPVWLNTEAGRRFLVGRINMAATPGEIRVERITVSWTAPFELEGVTLLDAADAPVLTARTGRLDRSLLDLLRRPNDFGTLTLAGVNLELVRRGDGSINLVEALGKIFDDPKPRRDFDIDLDGRLSFADPGLAAPFTAERFAFRLHLEPAPLPARWELEIVNPSKSRGATIEASGDFDRWRSRTRDGFAPDLSASVRAVDWKLSDGLAIADSARFDVVSSGVIGVTREGGRWGSTGELTAALSGSEIAANLGAIERPVVLEWKGWTEGEDLRVAGKLEAPALPGIDGSVALELAGRLAAASDLATCESFRLATSWGDLEGSGTIGALSSAPTIELSGALRPNYRRIEAELVRRVEPNAELVGGEAFWKLAGPAAALGDASRAGELTFDFALPIAHADLYGMELGATRFAGRWTGSLVTVEPIQTTLNGGRLMLRPEVDLEAEGGPVVRLGAGAAIRDARINDEVSRRVLSYVAPVLNQATQVNGTVSADLSSAVFPLVRAVGRKATVEGLVVFDDVTFGAGPLSRELLSLVIRDPGKLEQARLVIDQPVRLAIAEGRIEQHGLGLAVGNLARIELDGWVDFERNLALEASIPLNPELFPKVPLLNGVVRATRFRIPIGGTLDQPRVDGTAMKEGLSKLGQDVLQETAARGLVELFSAIGRPRDPNAVPKPPAPRLTPQERKAMRQEKQAERKRARSPRP